MTIGLKRITCLLGGAVLLTQQVGAVPMPKGAQPLGEPCPLSNFRIHLELSEKSSGALWFGTERSIPFDGHSIHDIAIEHPPSGDALLRLWRNGELVNKTSRIPRLVGESVKSFPKAEISLGEDFTAAVEFTSSSDGTLLAVCPVDGKWAPGSKALFIRDGVLVYDIGWLGELSGGSKVDDENFHLAVLRNEGGEVTLWLDGSEVAKKKNFTKPDKANHVLKIGTASENFGGTLSGGTVEKVRIWQRALPKDELLGLFKGDGSSANTPNFSHQLENIILQPVVRLDNPNAKVVHAWWQALERADHAEIVSRWNNRTLKKGRQIYQTSCVMCHGTKELPGSLPTARQFSAETFKNGSDPYSMVRTLTHGYGSMPAMPQFTTQQKYAVTHYIREEFLRDTNPEQYTEITRNYLMSLPKKQLTSKPEVERRLPPFYLNMDFGPAMSWTYQIERETIVQKGIAIRLDKGTGGVGKGKAWMVYDHDTMQFATATTGDFINWRSIAFDGSHGTHVSLTGERHFVNPIGPGWASPAGSWEDTRLLGKDGKRYGPLPENWAEYLGMYQHGMKSVIAVNVHGVCVLESPSWIEHKNGAVFVRTIQVEESDKILQLRVAPDSVNVALLGNGTLEKNDGYWVAKLKGGAKSHILISRDLELNNEIKQKAGQLPHNLESMTHGGPRQWTEDLVTRSVAGNDGGPFIVDSFPLPVPNPWNSLIRPGGFDFTPDGKSAVIASWNGDVWRVDGIDKPAPAELRWQRIATGLFQPLGVKFRGADLFVTCRDQLLRLHDLNDDGEIDFYECFNNDHQVTEHFHEFAMGLQTDDSGNFYYAKSARHARPALVPQHGTLLKISADGSNTDILATGLRAANGVCLNDDGSFFVTDQEGEWTPSNRINRIDGPGFYGNMLAYTDVTDPSDDAMRQPMVWMDDRKDRSPAELLRVPKGAWGNLEGSLLNLSYGMGRAYIVPHEKVGDTWQGAVYDLPIPAFPTGIMRGRFHEDGELYTCGLTSWASNAKEPGGFYRVRKNKIPAHVPIGVNAAKRTLKLTFSDPLDPESVRAESFTMKTWTIKRTKRYGSARHDQKQLTIEAANLVNEGRTVILEIPDLAPTPCYELSIRLRGADGSKVMNSMQGTIHRLARQ